MTATKAGRQQAIAVAVEAPAQLQRRGAQAGDVGDGAGLLEDIG
jgi:glutamate synthase domain-containing protein 1